MIFSGRWTILVVLMTAGAWAEGKPDPIRILVKTQDAGIRAQGVPLSGLPGWVRIEGGADQKREFKNLIRELALNPAVEWVEEDHRYQLEPVPMTAVGPSDSWALQKMGVPQALKHLPDGAPEVLVAVIDTGVDLNHPDLKDQIYRNPGEIPGNGKDDDQNGLIDDVSGWNFEAQTNDVFDDFHHGTHVAGIIGATSGNGIGIDGVSPKARILPVRWTRKGAGWGEDAIAAIHYSVQMGARVINASWGGIGYSKALEEAVREAEKKGILFVASAGNGRSNNDLKPRHPANLRFSNVIAVASTDFSDALDSYSNWGPTQVELGAPGKEILSTFMNGQYGVLSGTSMAAAQVSGVAALLFSISPNLDAQGVKSLLLKSVMPSPVLEGRVLTGGRVDAARAVDLLEKSLREKTVIDDGDLGGSGGREALGVSVIKPDQVATGSSVAGLSLTFVRRVKGHETPVEGITFKAQLESSGYQTFRSDRSGEILSEVCLKPQFSVNAPLESPRYEIASGSAPYELSLVLRCGIEQKIIFEEDSDSGQAIGIWQTVVAAEKKLSEEVNPAFWRRLIRLNWPGKGDYYSGDVVNLTAGHHWDVVGHELGHAIYDQASIGAFGGGQHYIDQCYSDALALSEGWASFFSAWVHLDLADEDARFEYMVPRRAPIRIENIPADVCRSPGSEWRVSGFFWDLIDTHADGETSAAGFSRLWNDLLGGRVGSVSAARERLITRGWSRETLEAVWKLNF